MKKQDYTPEQLEEAKAARKEYAREWRKQNPEKVKAAQMRFYLKQAEKIMKGGSVNDTETAVN